MSLEDIQDSADEKIDDASQSVDDMTNDAQDQIDNVSEGANDFIDQNNPLGGDEDEEDSGQEYSRTQYVLSDE